MISDEMSKKNARGLLAKATRSLAAARKHMQDADYDFACSRAYYAVFYAIEALLLTKNLTFSKHTAVISAFNEHFLKTGEFPKEFSKLVTRLFRNRQIGDYEFDVSIEKHQAEEDISSAQQIVESVQKYLTSDI